MDSSEILLLIAIIVVAVIVWGGGTAVFCCTGFESGLPFNSINFIEDNINKLESESHMLAKDFCLSIHDLSSSLKKKNDEQPKTRYIVDQTTFIDLELGLENQGKMFTHTEYSVPLLIMVSPAPEIMLQISE